MLIIKSLLLKILQAILWKDISSVFTINSTYVTAFTAYTNGKVVSFRITSKGAPDQTNLVTATPAQYRCLFDYYAVPCFFMNATDFARNTNVAVMSGGTIQIRCSTPSQGTGGVMIGGIYPIS